MMDTIFSPNHRCGFLTKLALLAEYIVKNINCDKEIKDEFIITLSHVKINWQIDTEYRLYRYIEKYNIKQGFNDETISSYFIKYFT